MIFACKITCLIVIAVIFIIIREGSALKCWYCRSDLDPHCADPFDNSTFGLVDCSESRLHFLPDARSHLCRKIRQKVHGVWLYERSCGFLGEPGIEGDERFCLLRTGTYNIFMEYCTCNSKDGCNSSNILKRSSLLTLLSLTLSFIVFKAVF